MRKLIFAALLIIGTASFAQETQKKHGKRDQSEQLTPEQRNQLQLKKLTLDLGLNESQQKEMSKILSEQSAKRNAASAERKAIHENGTKLTADQQFAKKNQMLDERIATKARVKKILNAQQFEKWEKRSEQNHSKMQHRIQKRDRKTQQPKNE